MVKKLVKYELLAYSRSLLPMLGILLGIAALTRLVWVFDNDSILYGIVSSFSVLTLVVTIMVCAVMTLVLGVTRFYRHLFTGEGYLTFTLPVTPAQHIIAKLCAVLVSSVVTLIAICLAVAVATAGDAFVEIIQLIGRLMQEVQDAVGAHLWLYLAELLLLALVGVIGEFLLFYTCIAIGQMARKNRILAAFGVYFAYYLLSQLVSTVVMAVLIVAESKLAPVFSWITTHEIQSVHLILCGTLLIGVVIAAVYFIITHTILRKKLNLE